MIKIQSLLELEKSSVSKNIRDYDLLIYGESGIGKSELILDLYGKDKTLALGFEDSYSGISGAYVVNIDNYSTLTAYLTQLENPAVREKFDTIVIDTLFLLDYCIEKSICDSYGVDLLGDALKYNKAYKIVDKKFLSIIKRLQKLGYTLVYVAHPVIKKIEIQGKEITKYEPKVSDRIKNLLLPEVDIHLFCYIDTKGERKIATRNTLYYDARCRVSEMKPLIDFNAETIKKEFEEGIKIKESRGENIIEQKEKVKLKEKTFEELKTYIVKDAYSKLKEKNMLDEANYIVQEELGREESGRMRTISDLTEKNIDTLKTIIIRIENLLNK